MEARYSSSPADSLVDPTQHPSMQQEPRASGQSPSHSSQTYTQHPSDSGHGSAGQSVTTLAEEQVQQLQNQVASFLELVVFVQFLCFRPLKAMWWRGRSPHYFGHLNFPIRQNLTPDRHDLSHAGTWAVAEPHVAASVVQHDPLLSPIHRAAVSQENAENANTDAVRILRASLDRKVPNEPSIPT